MGIVRLIVGAVTLGIMLGVGLIFGYEMTAIHLTGATLIAGMVSWWTGENSSAAGRNADPVNPGSRGQRPPRTRAR